MPLQLSIEDRLQALEARMHEMETKVQVDANGNVNMGGLIVNGGFSVMENFALPNVPVGDPEAQTAVYRTEDGTLKVSI